MLSPSRYPFKSHGLPSTKCTPLPTFINQLIAGQYPIYLRNALGGVASGATMGKVHRMGPGAPSKPNLASTEGGKLPAKWPRQQDHYSAFKKLIDIELEDELQQIEERWKKWSHKRMRDAGQALFNLVGRPNGHFFGEAIISFTNKKGSDLPWHQFSHGDIVILSRSKPWDEKVEEGIVLDRNRRRVRVVFPEKPEGIKKGMWRLDRGANRVAHDRMCDALESFHSTEGDGGTVLHDLLLANIHDLDHSSKMVSKINGKKKKSDVNLNSLILNESQKDAVKAGMERRLTLIQGPPGTGKTHTAVQILKVWAQQGNGPIIAVADSNVAVDNLVEGLIENGVNAVRLGKAIKVRDGLRAATLDAIVESHPDREEVNALLDDANEMSKGISSLKGRERGLAHRDLNRTWKEIRTLETRIIDDVLDRAEVVCCTCIGAGHRILGSRRFPYMLMDEATQATEPTSLVPLVRQVRQLVLVGDHRQLPATVISLRAEKGGLGRSLFERLIEAGITPMMLQTQYRMHPVLKDFPSGRFYDGRLEDGVSAIERPAPAGFIWPDWDAPVAFIPIEGVEQLDSEGTSKSNLDEAGRVATLVQELLAPGDLTCRDIGIITPYNGQVRVLSDIFENMGGRSVGEPYEGLEIKSVDGYQGREKEVIIFSAVRANEKGEIGFLSDRRRLNVAITRAKRGLIVLGNMKTLRHDHTWAAWLDWVQEKGLVAWHAVNG